jgi:hypothetical protein
MHYTKATSPFAPALHALRRSEAALIGEGHDGAVVARIDTALATHASIGPRMTAAFLRRVCTAEKKAGGGGDLFFAALPSAADVALAREALRFDAELVLVREALDRHPLPSPTTAALDAAPAAAVACRRAFVALFADDASRSAALRAALDARAEGRRRAVARALLPRSSSM